MPLTDPVPSSAFDVLERNVQDTDKFVNQETGTFTNRFGKVIKPIPVIEAEAIAAVISLGWTPVGEFSTGFTYTKLNDVGRDTLGSWWRYNGSDLPKVITAGTVPPSPNFSVISFETADNVQWEIGKSVGYSLDDNEGFKQALLAEAGKVDNGLPDTDIASQRLEAMKAVFDVYGTVADLAAGKFQAGKRVSVTDRGNEVFLVAIGYTPNGAGILSAGGLNSAIAQRRLGVFTSTQFGAVGSNRANFQHFLNEGGDLLVDADVEGVNALVRDNTNLTVNKTISCPIHGYVSLDLNGVKNVNIRGIGKIAGYGLFPSKNLNGVGGGGEKRVTLDAGFVWPQIGGGTVDIGLGSFGGGLIGNGGIGIFVHNGCEDIDINIETTGHSYAGVCIGNPVRVGTSEVRSKNVSVDGKHHHNYGCGISYHAVDNMTIKDSCVCSFNGHPDAVGSDDEVNPGYGSTGKLVGALGEAAKNIYIGGYYEGNKRKGVDAHSGSDIAVNARIKDSLVSGMAFGGHSGAQGRVIGQAIISNCGTATGALADAATAFSISGEYSSTDLKIIARECGRDYGFYVGPAIKSCKLDVDMKSSISARPFYVQGTLGNEVDLRISGSISGSYNTSSLMNYVTSGLVSSLDMSNCSYVSSTQDIIMTACNIDISCGNKWSRPLFNNGNAGYMQKARSKLSITYNGTSTPSVSFLDGEKYVSSQAGAGSGWSLQSVANSDNPAITGALPEFSGKVSWQTPRPTTNLLYSMVISGASSGREIATINHRDTTNTTLASTSADLNGMTMCVDIEWGYQL